MTQADSSQTVRSNEQMMQSMKGATQLLGSMNRQMNLPALQRIAMEFEKENDIMDQRQEMMDDAIDDVTGLEDEEESEEVVGQVLDELGVDLGQQVCNSSLKTTVNQLTCISSLARHPQAYRRMLWLRAELQKLLEEAILVMMTFRHDSTAYEDDDMHELYEHSNTTVLNFPICQTVRRLCS